MILREIEVAEGGRDAEMGWQALQRLASLSPTAAGPASRLRRRLAAVRRPRRNRRSQEDRLLVQPFLPQPPPVSVSLGSSSAARRVALPHAAAPAASDDPVHSFEVDAGVHAPQTSAVSGRP